MITIDKIINDRKVVVKGFNTVLIDWSTPLLTHSLTHSHTLTHSPHLSCDGENDSDSDGNL